MNYGKSIGMIIVSYISEWFRNKKVKDDDDRLRKIHSEIIERLAKLTRNHN